MLGATLSLCQRSGRRSGDVATAKPCQRQVLCSRDSLFQATGPCVTSGGIIQQERRTRVWGAAPLGDSGSQVFLSNQRDNTSCAGSRGTESQT